MTIDRGVIDTALLGAYPFADQELPLILIMKKALTASVAIRALFVSKINSRSGLLHIGCLDVTADVDPVVSLLTDLPLAAVSEDLLALLQGSN